MIGYLALGEKEPVKAFNSNPDFPSNAMGRAVREREGRGTKQMDCLATEINREGSRGPRPPKVPPPFDDGKGTAQRRWGAISYSAFRRISCHSRLGNIWTS